MDSDDYSTDEQTRKRRCEEQERFERSKKTMRTPTKPSNKQEDKLDMIVRIMQELKVDLKNEIQQVRADQKLYAEEIIKLKEENAALRKENEIIKEELIEIKGNIEMIEKEKRKNNVVLSGLDIKTNNNSILKEEMESFIKRHLGMDIEIKNTHKIGEKHCLIGLKNGEDKIKLMQNKHKLREIKENKIFLNNDMTKQERRIQRELRRIARSEREKGKLVKTGYNKIIVNGEEWRWNDRKGEIEKMRIQTPKN